MSTPALPWVGRGQPEPEAVVRPQRWDGTGSALFTGVPTRNSWRVQSSPLKMFLSLLQPAVNPRKLLSWSNQSHFLLLSSSNRENVQAAATLSPSSYCTMGWSWHWQQERKDSWEDTRDRRNLGKRGGYRWWGVKKLDLFLQACSTVKFSQAWVISSFQHCLLWKKAHGKWHTFERQALLIRHLVIFWKQSLK